MKKQLLIILLAGFVSITTACNKSQEPKSNEVTTASASEVTPSESPVYEDQSIEAKVTVLKFSDFQCPACKYFVPFEEQLKEDYGDDINIVYKNFPLGMHSYAQLAARSVEAARKQGKFHEYHDLLFEGQEQWSQGNAEAIFIGYARSLELDVDMFRTDMNSAEMNRLVMEDRREGRELGVNSTPTFFVNGDKIESNPRSYEAFKAIIAGYMD